MERRVLGGTDGFYGSTHSIEKTLDERDMVTVVDLAGIMVNSCFHSDVHGIPF